MRKEKFNSLLKKDYIILDGAMGTMLQAAGMKLGETPEVLNITNRQLIKSIHMKYLQAGADIIYANTFGANEYKLEDCGYKVEEIIEAGIKIAIEARDEVKKDALVALDLGPIGILLEPSGVLSFEAAYDIYARCLKAGAKAGADLVVFETMTDLLDLKAAVLAAKENTDLPIITTMTFEENLRSFTGCSISAFALTMSGLCVDAIGINCSLGPKELEPAVKELSKWTNLPLVLKPNAGLPDPKTNEYNLTAGEFADLMMEDRKYGIKFFGGCCGSNPEFIEELAKSLKASKKLIIEKKEIPAAICSATTTVIVNEPRVVGERINPTGKKKFQEALKNRDMDYILNQALEQASAGADILDVNVGVPGIDEVSMMIDTVKALQSVIDLPLQIDSTNPEVIEAALRVYNGRAIVNSVNGEEESLSKILPIVKKYGAAIIGLALDEDGIPKKGEDRLKIAKKILNRCEKIGINRNDIYIDCLTLTVSAEQDGCMETLKALRKVKEELGLKTILGVSNISFGLPNRVLINHIFLTMALQAGLDLCIINPNVYEMMGAVRAYKVLVSIDKNSVDYVKNYANMTVSKIMPESINVANASDKTKDKTINLKDKIGNYELSDLVYAVKKGLKNEAADITRELVLKLDTMEIINDALIPALDDCGAKFEKGTLFLPQLIMAASVASESFEVIKDKIKENEDGNLLKGKIVIATVKGDVHDIGKNIVKVLLENYGYDVIDLGKDVPYEAVVDAIRDNNVHLCGLSALMTTTLVSMKETIRLIRENNLDCKVMVGGAVLTPEYAKEIGADYYAKDAKESVDIARKVLN